uniref:Uncharacterized protein n=1 Tax=Ditylenchus dipsaci TaxID=166011 RepID=A0A915DH38_9BILA
MMRLPQQFVGSICVRIANSCSQLNGACSAFSCCRYSDVPSNKDPIQSSDKPAGPRTITSAEYNARRQDIRAAEVYDAETGHRPTASQRFFMVALLLYKNMASIPEYVGKGTMARYNDRMRILKIWQPTVKFWGVMSVLPEESKTLISAGLVFVLRLMCKNKIISSFCCA